MVLAMMNDREIGELTDLNSFCKRIYTINQDINLIVKKTKRNYKYKLTTIKKSDFVLYGNYATINDYLKKQYKKAIKSKDTFIYKGKKCFIATASLLDGEIEECYSFREYANSFRHHFITFSYSQIEKINRDENIVFIILDGKPIDYAKNNLTPPIASKILSQITLI